MSERGVVLCMLIILFGLAYIFLGNDENAMTECEETFSHSECFYLLNR